MKRRLAVLVPVLTIRLASVGIGDDGGYESLESGDVLVTVNDQPITKGDLEFELLWRRVPAAQQPAVRRQFAEELVDRQLFRGFLEQRRVEVPGELVDRQLRQFRQLTEAADSDFEEVISRLGFTQQSLREHLELPLAWRLHLSRVVTARQLQEFFAERREQFDGTRVRASQIVISVPEDADEEEWRNAEETLAEVQRQIVGGNLEFGEAARRYSTSPSRENGGDLGLFSFHGKLPASLAEVAFALELNAVSETVRSPFGVHLLTTTERVPGDLSLEDVRDEVLDQFSRRLWDEEAERLREEADIEWHVGPQQLGPTESVNE